MPTMLTTTDGIISLVILLAAELGAIVVTAVVLQLIIGFILSRVAAATGKDAVKERALALRRTIRALNVVVSLLLILGVLAYNAWVLFEKDANVTEHTLELIKQVPRETWIALAIGAGKTLVAVIVAAVVARYVRKGLKRLQDKVNEWDGLKANDKSLAAFFTGLERALINSAWLFVLVFAFDQLRVPESMSVFLFKAVTIYLIIAVGILIVRMTAVVVDTCDGLSKRFASDKSWFSYYDNLRPLIPLFRRCLEYALWIGIGTLVVMQLGPVASFAEYGPRLIKAVGVFFLGRVVIEVGKLFIDRSVENDEGLDELERRRRATVTPLFKSIFNYAAYFVILVLMLSSLGFEVMPLLAGAGILGVVVGLGAQPLINDVMSGFFVLFEHVFLVGDFVEVNGARGQIEAIDFRTTRLRDIDGRLHVIRNGEMRTVINYSKDFTCAVVELNVDYDTDLKLAVRLLEETGKQLAEDNADALAPAEVRGITEFGENGISIRTIIRVNPGCHGAVAAAYRMAIKEAFDAAGVRLASPRREVVIKAGGITGGPAAGAVQPA